MEQYRTVVPRDEKVMSKTSYLPNDTLESFQAIVPGAETKAEASNLLQLRRNQSGRSDWSAQSREPKRNQLKGRIAQRYLRTDWCTYAEKPFKDGLALFLLMGVKKSHNSWDLGEICKLVFASIVKKKLV